jgi:dTMP kinase
MATGTLITVSGVDGSGKSTLVAELTAQAAHSGAWPDVVDLAPLKGDRDLVSRVRELAAPADRWEPREKWLAGYFSLMLVDTAHRRILPALARGALVITDRWVLDHIVNQSYFGVSVAEWTPLFAALPVADLAVWVDVPAEVAQGRVAARARPGVGAGEEFMRFAVARFGGLAAGTHLRVSGTEPPDQNARLVLQRLAAGDLMDARL